MGLVNIIGAGPVGLHAAAKLAEEGFETTVFEEHSTIGRPVQCAGLVSKTGLKELKIEPGESTVNEVKGAKIFSPNGSCITVQKEEPIACVLDRYAFDQLLYKKAKRLGAEIRTDSKLIDLRPKAGQGQGSSLFMQAKGRGELLRSQITIGADGPHSVARHSIFPKMLEKEFVHAYQVRAEGRFDPNFVEMHFGNFAPGFFAWVIPESNRIARIGIGVKLGGNAAEALNKFLKEKQLSQRTLSKSSALIPIAPPQKQVCQGPILLVGDAAAQTKATTGGGLVFGLKAAEACAETIANHLKHKRPLEDYSKNLQAINKELSMHWKIYSYIQNLSPNKFDSLLAKAKNAGIEEFLSEHGDMDKPSKFMRKMLLKPRMWGLVPTVLRMR
jgi:geranylgeranyl reductase family protein